EVYESLEHEVPKTSMPSPGEVFELFNRLKSEGFTHVISIHISSGLSGTYAMVQQVASEIKGMTIEVIDSKALSMGLGFPVLEAVKGIRDNQGFQEVLERVNSVIRKLKVFFVLGTLDYLRQGGRIGYVSGTLGEILQLKPIISINEEGKYFTFTKVRGRKQSLSKMFEVFQEQIKGKVANVAVMHGAAFEEARDLMDKIKELTNVKQLFSNQIGPVMVVHTGPGLVGFALYEE
ncbi:MAG TPA: DegV family protein, partial [Verrucomicrobiae bacterium]|nr:DegV family protein [Verrucomicrobiae bacterium]